MDLDEATSQPPPPPPSSQPPLAPNDDDGDPELLVQGIASFGGENSLIVTTVSGLTLNLGSTNIAPRDVLAINERTILVKRSVKGTYRIQLVQVASTLN